MSNNNKKDYAVFINKKNSKKLVFYPVAKNANTSAKLFFIGHLGLKKNFFILKIFQDTNILKKCMTNILANII